MIKTLIKLALVALIANGSWRVASAYMTHYKFTDTVHQLSLFRGRQPDDALRKRIFQVASDYDIPVSDSDISLRTQDHHTIVEGAYTVDIELVPGFVYPWPFSFHIDTLSGIL